MRPYALWISKERSPEKGHSLWRSRKETTSNGLLFSCTSHTVTQLIGMASWQLLTEFLQAARAGAARWVYSGGNVKEKRFIRFMGVMR